MDLALDITLLVLNSTNTVIHFVGFYLLATLHKNDENDNIQRIFIMNLSITEAFNNLLILLATIPDFLSLTDDTAEIISIANVYVSIFMDYILYLNFYLTLFYITADRLACSLLNVRYPLYCSARKAKYLVVGTWTFGILLTIILSFLFKYYPSNAVTTVFVFSIDGDDSPFISYSHQVCNIGFTIFAVLTYSLIFRLYARSQRRRSTSGTVQLRSAFSVFVKSRFFIPILLVFTFIVFLITPNMVYLHYFINDTEVPYTLDTICWISFAISDFSDGIIYIFLQKNVRNLLWKKLKCGNARQIVRQNIGRRDGRSNMAVISTSV